MAHIKCGWASQSEHASANGAKGDQTKKEIKIGEWYDFGQNIICRFKDRDKGIKASHIMAQICKNDNFGYGQNDRGTMYDALKKAHWDPTKVKVKVNGDCSESVGCACNAVGAKVPSDVYTGNMVSYLKKTGMFKFYTDADHTRKDARLMKGDIILAESHHVIMALENGSIAQDWLNKHSK